MWFSYLSSPCIRIKTFSFKFLACEDMIVENFNVATLLAVWEWSSQPFGSKYVYRQTIHYFSEEFCILCKAPIFLANVPSRFMLSVIKSDFLQVSYFTVKYYLQLLYWCKGPSTFWQTRCAGLWKWGHSTSYFRQLLY